MSQSMIPVRIHNFLSNAYSSCLAPNHKVSVAVTGGGIQSLSWLFTIPGASSCMMGGSVPYARSSVNEMLQNSKMSSALLNEKFQYVGREAVIAMAMDRRRHAIATFLEDANDLHSLTGKSFLGIACSASLATNYEKKGDHKCYVASVDADNIRVHSVSFQKGLRTREEEDVICSKLVIDVIRKALARAEEKEDREIEFFSAEDLVSGENLVTEDIDTRTFQSEGLDIFDDIYQKRIGHSLLFLKEDSASGDANAKEAVKDGGVSLQDFEFIDDVNLPARTIVYPGSFNPLHEGHVKLVVAAIKTCNRPIDSPVVFEIAAVNADKPPIEKDELLRRAHGILTNPILQEFGLTNVAVSITSEPLFMEKSTLFKSCDFVVGADTMTRLINPKYYGRKDFDGSVEREHQFRLQSMISALSSIRSEGCRFIVGGRTTDGNFTSCKDILDAPEKSCMPEEIKAMFRDITEDEFRVDISSTELRAVAK